MYIPQHFEENRKEILVDLIEKNPLRCLISHHNHELDGNHIPFLYDAEHHVLLAHIAKLNPLTEVLREEIPVLVVFKVQDAYVSPNWYLGKSEHHRVVPTWNYVVIHAKGVAKIVDDEKVLRGILAKLTRTHEEKQQQALQQECLEQKKLQEKAWKMSDAPADFIQQQLEHIVAIRVDITSLIGKFKLSQNRNQDDILSVANALLKQGKNDLHQMMSHAFEMH